MRAPGRPSAGPPKRLALVLLITALGTGCVRGCKSSRPPIHINPNMDYQEKVQPQEGSLFFYDGVGMRRPPEGTVARGELHDDARLETGKEADGAFVTASPVPVTEALLARGARQYGIYCAPCHTEKGDGQGILFDQGVATANLHDERIRALPDGEIFDVISHGKGLMQGYGYPVPPPDRWAIIAHVRALQARGTGR